MSKPAPTPYSIEPYVDAIDILDANGKPVAHIADRPIGIDCEPPANAKFIVRACNSHEQLLEACKSAEHALLEVYRVFGGGATDLKALRRVQAAIRAAEKGGAGVMNEETFQPGDPVRDKWDGKRGVVESIGGDEHPLVIVNFEQLGLCRVMPLRLIHDNAKQDS